MSRYIDVSKLYNKVIDAENYYSKLDNFESQIKYKFLLNVITSMIDSTPSEDVALVKHSHWVEKIGIKPKQGIKYPVVGCLNCGTVVCDLINVHGVIYHYCPHCGAKMDE